MVVCLKQCFLNGAYFKIIHTLFCCSFLKVKPFFPQKRETAGFLIKLNRYSLIVMLVRIPLLINIAPFLEGFIYLLNDQVY